MTHQTHMALHLRVIWKGVWLWSTLQGKTELVLSNSGQANPAISLHLSLLNIYVIPTLF